MSRFVREGVLPTTLPLRMQAQPDDRSCGPTCLQAVYAYYGRELSVNALTESISQLETGGTLAVQLGCDALRRDFEATIYTYNLQLFDPTWFVSGSNDLNARLREQLRHKDDDGRLGVATDRYLEFLDRGGRVAHELLTPALLQRFLEAGTPILTGLSSTYLYEAARERPRDDRPDDIRGQPVGHFVVLCGYDGASDEVTLADPWPHPDFPDQIHRRPLWRVIASILLGVLTYDANLLVIRPK